LKGVTFKATDCELLEGAKYKYALRHIIKRRSSMPNCTSIVNYREKYGLSEESLNEGDERDSTGNKRSGRRHVIKRSITR
jgi:hypothetical protein